MNRHRRTILGPVATRALSAEEKSAGYIGALTGIIPLNTDSGRLVDRRLNSGRPFVERIAPRAFEGASDVVAVVGHTDDPLAAVARQGANLTLSETATELRWEALLPDTSAARDLLQLGEKKIIRGTSFEFDLGAADTWEKRADGTAVRTVTKGQLRAVNPVLWPAYDDSSLSVSLRSRLGRGIYAGVDAYDSTMTPDVQWACYWLAVELAQFTEAQDYLRDNPTGAFADYARAAIVECGGEVKNFVDWLTANGGTAAADLVARASTTIGEHRTAAAPAAPSLSSRAYWEKRLGLR